MCMSSHPSRPGTSRARTCCPRRPRQCCTCRQCDTGTQAGRWDTPTPPRSNRTTRSTSHHTHTHTHTHTHALIRAIRTSLHTSGALQVAIAPGMHWQPLVPVTHVCLTHLSVTGSHVPCVCTCASETRTHQHARTCPAAQVLSALQLHDKMPGEQSMATGTGVGTGVAPGACVAVQCVRRIGSGHVMMRLMQPWSHTTAHVGSCPTTQSEMSGREQRPWADVGVQQSSMGIAGTGVHDIDDAEPTAGPVGPGR
jgi:hypothetical protein